MCSSSLLSDANEPDTSLFESNGLSCQTFHDCLENEVCKKSTETSHRGICECSLGYKRNLNGTKY